MDDAQLFADLVAELTLNDCETSTNECAMVGTHRLEIVCAGCFNSSYFDYCDIHHINITTRAFTFTCYKCNGTAGFIA